MLSAMTAYASSSNPEMYQYPNQAFMDEGENDRGSLPKGQRLSYTRYQLEILNFIYTSFRYPNNPQKLIIAKRIGITKDQVKIWFQNRRRKDMIGKPANGRNHDASAPPLVPESIKKGIVDELLRSGDKALKSQQVVGKLSVQQAPPQMALQPHPMMQLAPNMYPAMYGQFPRPDFTQGPLLYPVAQPDGSLLCPKDFSKPNHPQQTNPSNRSPVNAQSSPPNQISPINGHTSPINGSLQSSPGLHEKSVSPPNRTSQPHLNEDSNSRFSVHSDANANDYSNNVLDFSQALKVPVVAPPNREISSTDKPWLKTTLDAHRSFSPTFSDCSSEHSPSGNGNNRLSLDSNASNPGASCAQIGLYNNFVESDKRQGVDQVDSANSSSSTAGDCFYPPNRVVDSQRGNCIDLSRSNVPRNENTCSDRSFPFQFPVDPQSRILPYQQPFFNPWTGMQDSMSQSFGIYPTSYPIKNQAQLQS